MPRPARLNLAEQLNPLRIFAFYAALFYIFLRFSYIHEKAYMFGINIGWMNPLSMAVAIPAVLLAGGFIFTVQHRLFLPWIGFIVWLTLALPFSSWKGGSLSDLLSYLRVDFVIVFMAGGLVASWQDVRRLMRVLALTGAVNVLYSLTVKGESARVALDAGGSIGNANDLAAHLLFLLPFCLFEVLSPVTAKWLRLFFAAVIGIGLVQVVGSASRGALLGLLAGSLLSLLILPGAQRVAFVVIAALGTMGVVAVSKPETLARISNFNSAEDGDSSEAAGSFSGRQYLLRKSIEFTFSHPIFGVGLGQFATYEGSQRGESGERGMWHATHNAYTQVSSENGIPALLFYVWAIFAAFGAFWRIHKQALRKKDPERRVAAFCGMLSLVMTIVTLMFLSLALRGYYPMATALAIAMTAMLQMEGFWVPPARPGAPASY